MDTIELTIDGIAHGGLFVARVDGRVVFVPDAIPGERVLARVVDDSKASFWRAELVEVLEASPHRQPHVQPESDLDRDPADRAGGADLGHIAIAEQRRLKGEVLRDALRRQGRLDADAVAAIAPDVQAVAGTADGTGWRTRMRLQVLADGRLGAFGARSHRAIALGHLPLATDAIREALPPGTRFEGASTVDAIDAASGIRIAVDGAYSKKPVTERVGERDFVVEEGGFWQVHPHAAATLSTAAVAAVDPDRWRADADNLDLYGGVGLFAATLGDAFGGRITSVEQDRRASLRAEDNLGDLAGADVVAAETLAFLRGRGQAAGSTVLLDPPRAGAGRAVVDELARIAPAQIVYVACDPVALSRDIAFFAGHGYTLDTIEAFDLFPNTHHLEAVARFTAAE